MLNIKILNIIGIILIFLGISMIPSAMWSFAYSDTFNLSDKEFFDFIAILKSSIHHYSNWNVFVFTYNIF